MSADRDAAYCGCGTKLARDNRSSLCARCRRHKAARLMKPPPLPEDFWYSEDLRAACAQRHMGKVIRAYRHHRFHGQACALAVSGLPVEASRAMVDAERAFTDSCTDSSPWLSPFDAAALTMESARCLMHIGDLLQAEQLLRAVLTHRRADRVRSRALAQLMLVTVLLSQGRLDEACDVVDETIDCTTALGSAVVVGHLRHAALLLGSHAARSRHIPALLERLRDAVTSRAWIGISGAGSSAGVS